MKQMRSKINDLERDLEKYKSGQQLQEMSEQLEARTKLIEELEGQYRKLSEQLIVSSLGTKERLMMMPLDAMAQLAKNRRLTWCAPVTSRKSVRMSIAGIKQPPRLPMLTSPLSKNVQKSRVCFDLKEDNSEDDLSKALY